MKILQVILTVILIQTIVFGQDTLHHNPFWLNWSLGGSPQYLNGSFSYNKALENLSYQIAINGTTKDLLSQRGMNTGNVGIGISNQKVWLISAIYFGPSVSYGKAKEKFRDLTNFWGVGVSLNAQVYFMPLHKLFPGLGIGAEWYYNTNIIQTKNVDYKNVYTFRLGVCITNLHMH